ncbi:MoxR family ATPase [Pseudoflavitalea sp. X16]|uniref:AAA family ATPase n=1 Tax=Paraflavitalea devenefica TaxID=2716334 RepID=UPI0014242FF7|nr:MoxR family ATPase [Paraflavitalea devenefica]NII28168.1 MoxR family ATPase [Paraflavitalea devenefica]
MSNLRTTQLQDIQNMLEQQGYITDKSVAMSVFLSLQLNKPLLVEGPAGVGKTEIAKVMANALKTDLIRLQCYEGLDATHALYEWNYQRQLLHLKMTEHDSHSVDEKEKTIFSDAFLMKRPLLQAITHHQKPVLLIDEIDRSDEEFESFLLEMLSDWQITIPEIGTMKATFIPQVILTSNRTRELSEALRRRCLYLYIDYPDFEKEWLIVKNRVPGVDAKLGAQITRFMQELRLLKLEKTPGIAETIDWAVALSVLHVDHLDKTTIEQTLGVVLKEWRDTRQVQMSLSELMEKTKIHSKFDSP